MTRSLALLAAVSTAALAAVASAQAPKLTEAEARLLYAAGGFPISADGKGPMNRCGQRATPAITFLDLNSDKRADALFVDAGTCYGADQRWFAMVIKEANGSWRSVGGFPGTAKATSMARNGWMNISWTSKGTTQPLAYNGQIYAVGGAATTAPSAVKPPASATAKPLPVPAPATPPASATAAAKPAAPAPSPSPAAAQSPAARDAAIFRAAGFKQTRRGWESGCDDPSTGSIYEAGQIDQVKDLNGDGRPDAVVIEGGSYCYGNTGQGFWVVSQQANGSWKLIFSITGIPEFLKTKGAGGWPDISIGGPGFCFPVWRFNGKEYDLQRHEYEGKACRPPRM